MQLQIYCPCCNEKAMSLWQKLTLSRYSIHACRSCGNPLGIESTAMGWFFLGWVPFSLSGYFSLPFKFLLGGLGIGLILCPHAFLVPLVKKTETIGNNYPRWLISWLVVLALSMFASDWVNLLPSTETKIVAFGISIVFTPVVIREFWQRVPKADEKMLVFIVISALVASMHYFVLSCFPPALLTFFSATEVSKEATVVYKRHSSKLTRCSNKADIVFLGEDDQKHEICFPEKSWEQIKKDDIVSLRIRESEYGRLVTAVETSNGNRLTN